MPVSCETQKEQNGQIREDRVGVSTTADNPNDFDCMINRASLDEIN